MRRTLRRWMKAQAKVRTRGSNGIQRRGKRGRNFQHKGERKLKRFSEPWTKRTRELEQLSPDKL